MNENIIDLPSVEDRPLVTFAIFSHNQETYIREAVEGAFAQIYEPLEIILSDDCSTDRTFEIMKELASAYHGKHQVVLNKTADNLGTIDHIFFDLAEDFFAVVFTAFFIKDAFSSASVTTQRSATKFSLSTSDL